MEDHKDSRERNGARPKTQRQRQTGSRSEDDILEEMVKHMPKDIKNDEFFDVLIIHGQKDITKLQNLIDFEKQISDIDNGLKVALFNRGDSWLGAKNYEEYITEDAIARCILIFLFVDEHFIRDWSRISSTGPIRDLLYDRKQQYRLVPIQTIPPGELRNGKLPMPLDSLSPLDYYRNDNLYRSKLRKTLNKTKPKRKEAEENHKKCKQEWLKNNFSKYKDKTTIEEDGDSAEGKEPRGNTCYIIAENVIYGDRNKMTFNINHAQNDKEESEDYLSQPYRVPERVHHSESTETGYHSADFSGIGDESRDCGPDSNRPSNNEYSLKTPVTPVNNIASMRYTPTDPSNDKKKELYSQYDSKANEQHSMSWSSKGIRAQRRQMSDRDRSENLNRSTDRRNESAREGGGMCPSFDKVNFGNNASDVKSQEHQQQSMIGTSKTDHLDWSILSDKSQSRFNESRRKESDKCSTKVCPVKGIKSEVHRGQLDEDETSPKMPTENSERSHSIDEETTVKQVENEEDSQTMNSIISHNGEGGVPISFESQNFHSSFSSNDSDETSASAVPVGLDSRNFHSSFSRTQSNEKSGHAGPLGMNSQDSEYSFTGTNPSQMAAHGVPVSLNSFVFTNDFSTNESSSHIDHGKPYLSSSSRSYDDSSEGACSTSYDAPLAVAINSLSLTEIDGVSPSPVCNITNLPLSEPKRAKKEDWSSQSKQQISQNNLKQSNLRRKPMAAVSPMVKH